MNRDLERELEEADLVDIELSDGWTEVTPLQAIIIEARTRADRLEAALREIARLHTEVTVETVPNECLRGICGHEDGCPDSDPVSVCDRCWELWDDGFNRDDAVPDAVRWPCETRRMLGAALEGDEG